MGSCAARSRCCDTSQPKGRGNGEHKLRPKPARQSPTLLKRGLTETWTMATAKRARKAETPKHAKPLPKVARAVLLSRPGRPGNLLRLCKALSTVKVTV
jgi:hypothetical protein